MKNYLNPHPFGLLCNREYVLRILSSWTIWTTRMESAFLHEVPELPLRIVAIYTSPMIFIILKYLVQNQKSRKAICITTFSKYASA